MGITKEQFANLCISTTKQVNEMKNPIYLTDQELEAWHIRNFGTIPYADGSDCVDLFDASNDGAMREHCIELYRMATTPVTFEFEDS